MKLGWVWLVFGLGLLRWFLGSEINQVFITPISNDTPIYDETAINLVKGNHYTVNRDGKTEFVYWVTPGFSMFLAWWYRFFGTEGILSPSAKRIVGIIYVLNGLQIIGSLIWGKVIWCWTKKRRLAMLVSIGVMVYLPLIVLANTVLSEVLSFLLMGLVLWWTKKVIKNYEALGLGGLTGYLILVKPYLVYVPVGVMVWFWRQKIVLSGWFLAGVAAVLGVWLMVVQTQTGRWVPLQAGYNYVVNTGSSVPNTGSKRERQPTILETVWWHAVYKPRHFLAYPLEVLTIFRQTPEAKVFASIIKIQQWLITVGVAIWGGIKGKRIGGENFLGGLALTAVLVHSWLWSLPRYAVVLMPMMIFFAISGYKKLLQIKTIKMLSIRWWFLGWWFIICLPAWIEAIGITLPTESWIFPFGFKIGDMWKV